LLEGLSGLKCGKDFYLAHCPERIDPGNPNFFVGNLNRVVGGITPKCTQRAVDFYRSVIDAEIRPLGSTEEAEFVKSWENSHRNVMIALANEAAIICDALDMDIDNVLSGLQSKIDQFGLRLAKPGIGPGGHCIPEDIHYVIRKARQSGVDTRFLESAAELNDKMSLYAVQQLQFLIASHGSKLCESRVALLGLAYKENIEDARRSPAIGVAQLLVQRAGSVIMHDPYVDMARLDIRGVEIAVSLDGALEGADAVFLATAHDAYIKNLDPALLKKHGIAAVYDGRNCLNSERIKAVGIAYHGMGRS
jgi:UDP-N-acetyl-D-glucosamine dehydrogenase